MRRTYIWLIFAAFILSIAALRPWEAPPPAAHAHPVQQPAQGSRGDALTGVPLRANWWAVVPGIDSSTKISSKLATQFAQNGNNAPVGFMVYLKAQANTTNSITGWNAKGEYVLQQLERVANATQPSLMQAVAEQQARNNLTSKVTQFTIINAIFVHGNIDAATSLASRDDVAFVDADHRYYPMDNGGLSSVAGPQASVVDSQSSPETVELGVNTVHAPQVWAQGYTGTGIVVGSIDTGVQYDHPALIRQYRGNLGGGNFDHNYNWWDTRTDAPPQLVPYDDAGHGTHTMGTVLGEDASQTNQIGVAPGARWIAAKVFPLGGSSGNEEITPAEDFMLAPWDLTGQNRRPDLRPHIITNSWGDNECYNTDSVLITQVWIDAGIMPFFANGNAGPGAGSVGSPGGYPFLMGVGAISASSFTIAGFSSRGPSCYGGVLKPDAVAPGVTVRSSVPTNGYTTLSGTSMATPHMSGVAALILDANPSLTYTDVMGIITRTAFFSSTWGVRPNNNYGWGLVQADAAVNMAIHGPHLNGTVNGGGSPLQGALVTARRTTDGDTYGVVSHSGAYSMTLLAGTYDVTASAFGYNSHTVTALSLLTDTTVTQDFDLVPLATFPVSGQLLLNGPCTPISGTVTINPPGSLVLQSSPSTGSYSVNLPAGTYTFTVNAGVAYQRIVQAVTVSGPTTQNFTIGPAYDSTYVVDTPPFTWISATTRIANFNNAEDGFSAVTLPFGFTFYTMTNTTLNVSTNGYATFDSSSEAQMWANTEIPNPGPVSHSGAQYQYPNNAIYPYWDDLAVAPRAYGDVYYDVSGSAPNRIFVVEWRGVAGAGNPITFEMQLEESTNRITFLYQDVDAPYGYGYSSTEGIESAGGTSAIMLSFNQMGQIGNGTAVRFTPGTPPAITPCTEPTPSPTTTPATTPQPTSTVCPITFTDVQPGSTFYDFVRCLACRGIINGYPDGTFKPNNNVTRGQLSKIVSNSAGFIDPQTVQMFQDVPPGSTFFDYIGRLASRGYIAGYPCGTLPSEPCVAPGNLPYFRVNNNATRGQISKIVSNAAGFTDPATGQTFQDVPPGSTFYDFIERLAGRGAIGGYTCGSSLGEPCVPPENRPYFRPNANATRGQTSKIVANTFFPACSTPSGGKR